MISPVNSWIGFYEDPNGTQFFIDVGLAPQTYRGYYVEGFPIVHRTDDSYQYYIENTEGKRCKVLPSSLKEVLGKALNKEGELAPVVDGTSVIVKKHYPEDIIKFPGVEDVTKGLVAKDRRKNAWVVDTRWYGGKEILPLDFGAYEISII